MQFTFIIGLIHNVAIMLLFAWVYDLLWVRLRLRKTILTQLVAGVAIGLIIMVLMKTPALMFEGLFFDMRSVFISTIAFFIGGVPAIIGVLIAIIFRYSIGGPGVYMGIASMIGAGVVGYVFRYILFKKINDFKWYHFLSLGIWTHLVMGLCILLLPSDIILLTANALILPLISIYPIANVLMGLLLVKLKKNYELTKQFEVEKKRLDGIIEATNVGTFEWNINTGELSINERWASIIGYTKEELAPISVATWNKFVHPNDLEYSYQQIQLHIDGKIPYYQCELRMKHKDGYWVWILDRGKVTSYTPEGKASIMMGTHTDISKRKASEIALARSEKVLNDFFSLSTAGFFFMMLDEPIEWNDSIDKEKVLDYVFDHHKITRVNKAMLDQYGGLHEVDIIGKSPRDFFVNDIAHGKAVWRKFFDEGRLHIETNENKIDGSDIYILGDYVCLYDESGKIIGHYGVQIDITSTKLKEKQIDKLSKAIEQSPVSVVITDINGNIEYVNKRFEEVSGYSFDDVINKNPKILNAGVLSHEVYDDLWKTISNGKIWVGEVLNKKKNGELYWESASISPIIDERGRITHYVGVKEDITDKKKDREELFKAKELAEVANKAKSEFLANMSHEIRTPLNGVIGFTDLLNTTTLSEVQRQYVSHILSSASSLLGVINDILDFSKIEAGMFHLDVLKADLYQVMYQSIEIFKHEASKKQLEILLDIDDNLPRNVFIDPVRLKQIFANLLSNAIKFTAKGEIELKVKYKKEKDNAVISFYIRDTGIGIAKKEQEKLFKAFSQADGSTTRRFGGTGLGLIISQKIAEQMGSKIELESQVGIGTTFKFTLVTKADENETLPFLPLTRIKRCLLIDDNITNSQIIQQMLTSFELQVVSCYDALSAMVAIQENPDFDLIVCDYNMPVLNGLQTIETIQTHLGTPQKSIPCIMMYSSVDVLSLKDECAQLGINYCISKPVFKEDLIHYIKAIDGEQLNENTQNKLSKKEFTQIGNISILIVEDNEFNMLLIKAMVEDVVPNVKTHLAYNGLEALDILDKYSVDLVLMDLQMPIMGGIEATQKIREKETQLGIHTPIIAVTANTLVEERDKCMQVGMDAFLSKPIIKAKFIETLQHFLS